MGRRKKTVTEIDYEPTDVLKIEDMYTVINYVQTTRKECTVTIADIDSCTVEHILKDIDMSFEIKKDGKGTRYTIFPPPERDFLAEKLDFEEYPDELLEEGQCF